MDLKSGSSSGFSAGLRAPIRASRLLIARREGSRSTARSRAEAAARSGASGRLLSVAMYRVYVWRSASDGHQAREVQVTDRLAARKEVQVHEHRHPVGDGAAPLDQPAGGGDGATRGQDVVDQEHPVTRLQPVAMGLQGRLAVLEGVGLGVGL